jgi:hypothetical protein
MSSEQVKNFLWEEGAVRGTSVSITVTPDGHTLFVAVVDKEDGLRIYRIPVRSVP